MTAEAEAWVRAVPRRLSEALPAAAAAAEQALDQALRPLRRSAWPEVAWSASRLAPGGMPVEFVWRPGSPSISWTSEAAAPERSESRGLALALRRLRALAAARPPRRLVGALRRAQAGRALDWGAWIGGRHDAAGDRYKLYACLPAGASPPIEPTSALCADWLGGRDLRLAGLGADGRVELYGRGSQAGLGAVAGEAELGEAWHQVGRLAEALTGRADIMAEPEAAEAGWSLAFAPDGALTAAALFLKPGLFAFHPQSLDRTLAALTTDRPSDRAWARLFAGGLCRPGLLGLAATKDGVRTQLSATRPRDDDARSGGRRAARPPLHPWTGQDAGAGLC